MARIRTIKPDFWTDERVGECSVSARLLFIACWNFSDDHGGLDRSAKQLKAQAFPYDNVDCEPLVLELLKVGLLIEYEVSGKKYLHIKGFRLHQKVEKPAKPRIPLYEHSGRSRVVVGEESHGSNGKSPASSGLFSGREWKGREGSVGEPPPKTANGHPHTGGGEEASGGSGPYTLRAREPTSELVTDSASYEQAILAKFPVGKNAPNWTMAMHHASQLVSDGLSTWPELVAATERYAAYYAANKHDTNIAAHNFFDRRKGNSWQQPWTIVSGANGKEPYVPPKSVEQLENEAIAQGVAAGKSDFDIAAEIDVPLERVRQYRESAAC